MSGNISLEEELKQILLGEDRLQVSRIEKRLSDLAYKIGSPPEFSSLVSNVLNDSFQVLDQDERARIISTLARLISNPVKREIRNAQPEIMQAVHPVAHALVAKGIKNAMANLQDSINTTIKEKFSLIDDIKLTCRSIYRRKSKAALWLEDHPEFNVDTLLLIDRTTGLLIAGASNDETDDNEGENQRFAGLLSALEIFAEDTLSDDFGGKSGLKQISTNEDECLLTNSPAYTFVARIKGIPPKAIGRDFEKAFFGFIENWGDTLKASDNAPDMATLSDLKTDLEIGISQLNKSYGPAPMSPKSRKVMFTLFAAAFFGLLIWWGFSLWHDKKISSLGEDLRTNESLSSYALSVDEWGGKVHVRGIVLSTDEQVIVRQLASKHFDDEEIEFHLAVMSKVDGSPAPIAEVTE
ncbi:MAG: hypothetical protein ACPGVN_05235 [Alphaproteobacteria bacterium]